MSAERVDRLPKWAQRHLSTLEADVAYWKAQALAGPKESNTFTREGLHDDRPLGVSPTVRFVIVDAAERRHQRVVEAQVDRAHGFLELRTGLGALEVSPQAANVVRIRVGDWW